jgi:hypothetical protein
MTVGCKKKLGGRILSVRSGGERGVAGLTVATECGRRYAGFFLKEARKVVDGFEPQLIGDFSDCERAVAQEKARFMKPDLSLVLAGRQSGDLFEAVP